MLVPKAPGYATIIDLPPDVAANVVSELPRLARAVKEATGGINIVQVLIIAGHDFLLSRFSASLLLRHRIMAHLQAYDQTLRGLIVPDDYVDEGNGSAREPEGTGGSAAAEGADTSAAAECTRSGRRGLPPRRSDGAVRGERYAKIA